MTTPTPPSSQEALAPQGSPAESEPRVIIKRKHPLRTLAATLIVIFAALFIIDASQRPAYDWSTVGLYIFDRRVVQAAVNTLQLTIYSMVIAVILGLILAVMRQSPNPILRSVSWFYLWLFRGTPVYVQLVFWGLLAVIYQTVDIGIPFMQPWVSFETTLAFNAFTLAVIGLAMNEAAYMAEIMRSGLMSVDHGQEEAAVALGMTWFQSMRRIVIPQAMRVVIPPTGNEVISMLKTTSLVIAVPYSFDLYSRTRDISSEIFNPIPLLLVASIWYLAFTSVLMVGQHFLEKKYSRGAGKK
ncbi:amino acid ABC transporter permease [uncultured Aurantimicrobium sp.]|uniref:amino acid ABC transporter permease n=1 Tax=uncultured Aurantimicrobium sp. TaxID=1705357 RepID=UPI0026031CF8|nr:amino acid ABC transporter permease [uncultured Aurantimicrobium sp.]